MSKIKIDSDKLTELYNKGLTVNEIATKMGFKPMGIYFALYRLKLKIPSDALIERRKKAASKKTSYYYKMKYGEK